MSDLSSSLAALAERLGARPGPARVPEEIADRPSAPGVVDLTGILAMPLDQFAREGRCLEIRVAWHTETLWFVPDERDAAALRRDGVGRGRVACSTRTRGGSARTASTGAGAGRGGRRAGPGEGDERDDASDPSDPEIGKPEGERLREGRPGA